MLVAWPFFIALNERFSSLSYLLHAASSAHTGLIRTINGCSTESYNNQIWIQHFKIDGLLFLNLLIPLMKGSSIIIKFALLDALSG